MRALLYIAALKQADAVAERDSFNIAPSRTLGGWGQVWGSGCECLSGGFGYELWSPPGR